MSPRFPTVTPGVQQFPISLFAKEMAHLVHVGYLYLTKRMVVGICWRLMLLLVMGVGFENISTV